MNMYLSSQVGGPGEGWREGLVGEGAAYVPWHTALEGHECRFPKTSMNGTVVHHVPDIGRGLVSWRPTGRAMNQVMPAELMCLNLQAGHGLLITSAVWQTSSDLGRWRLQVLPSMAHQKHSIAVGSSAQLSPITTPVTACCRQALLYCSPCVRASLRP
jgi:hypothetical protein